MSDSAFAKALQSHAESDARQFEAMTDALAGIAKDIGRMSESIHNLDKKMDERFSQIDAGMKPLLEIYSSALLGKKLLVGVTGIIVLFATVGAAIIEIWGFFTHK